MKLTASRPFRVGPLAPILLGAAVLLWPAALNRYPILFSDTGGLLEMGFQPSMGWDKPFVYGPLLAILSLRLTLWLPLVAQGVLLSYLLWLTDSVVASPRAVRHLLVCVTVAAGTAAPWITATLMPDVFTPVVVLGIAALTFRRLTRPHVAALTAITAIAIAAHLSHLILAPACIAAAALLRRAVPRRPLVSLAAAVAFLLASNAIGHGRFGISPYGSVFALARLIGDGPARDYLERACPQAGYRLCAWRDKLTDDSDQFLWDPQSPFWLDPAPLPAFAAEAAAIVRETVLTYPTRVIADAVRNGARQLVRFRIGDTLVSDHLNEAVRPRLARWLPADTTRFDRSLQARGELEDKAQPLLPLHLALLAFGALASAIILAGALRRPSPAADLAAMIVVALAANALATGALSTVHDRYQARIAWLITLPPLLSFRREPASGQAALASPR